MKRAALVALCALLPTAALSACGSTEKRPEVTAEQELVVARWRAGGIEWELERERVRADPALCAAFVDQLVIEMVHAWDRSSFARPGGAPGAYERARAELIELGPQAIPLLAGLFGVGDGVVSWLAGDVLVAIGPPAVPRVAALLGASNEESRRRAAELCARLLADPVQDEELERRLALLVAEDPAWVVRATALRSLAARAIASRVSDPEHADEDLLRARDTARSALHDPEPAVGEAAAKALGALGDPRAVPALIDALERAVHAGEPRFARASQEALRELTGADAASPQAWRALWRERGSRAGR